MVVRTQPIGACVPALPAVPASVASKPAAKVRKRYTYPPLPTPERKPPGGKPVVRPPIPLAPRITPDFERYAERHFPGSNFARGEVKNGSFGGRVLPTERLAHQPVIFIHGNGDSAFGSEGGTKLNGWRDSVHYFLDHGYRSCELYGTTWGPANADEYLNQSHDRANLMQVRKFIEAVIAYTGADKVDIIAHSMGVTLARKAIKGGTFTDPWTGDVFDLGPPLSAHVDTFVGIAGANVGLEGAFYEPDHPVTSRHGGFYPGIPTPLGIIGMADILEDVNSERGYEGDHCYSVWTKDDQFAGLVWGRETSRIPGQDGEAVFRTYDHFDTRDRTARTQYEMVAHHVITRGRSGKRAHHARRGVAKK